MIDTEDCADSYVADGTANPRSIGFRIFDPSYLVVLADGLPQTLNRDYTISGDYDGSSGLLTPSPLTPWPAGTVIVYQRATPPLQKAKILPGVPLPSADVVRELDRRAMIEQEQARDLADTRLRALMVPTGQIAPIVPAPADMAGKLYGASADGRTIVPVSPVGTIDDGALRIDLANPDAGALLVARHDPDGNEQTVDGALDAQLEALMGLSASIIATQTIFINQQVH